MNRYQDSMPGRAEFTGDVFLNDDMESCETAYFQLRDNVHEFIMGLSDILMCLKFAEKEGAVPELPPFWWSMVSGSYPKLGYLVRDYE